MQSRLLKQLFPLSAAVLLAGCSAEDATLTGLAREAIINGEPSDETEDEVVRLTVRRPTSVGSCSGTLIAPDVLVTALHCVAYRRNEGTFSCAPDGSLTSHSEGAGELGAPLEPQNVEVYFGAASGNTPDARGMKIFGSGSTQVCRSDIAVVVLDTALGSKFVPLRFGRNVRYGERVRVVGYGGTETGTSGVRKTRDNVKVTAVGDFGGVKGSSTTAPNTFVTPEGGCQGDSGGPAYAQETGALVGTYSLSHSACTSPSVRNGYVVTAAYEDLLRKGLEFAGREPVIEPEPPTSGGAGAGGMGGGSGGPQNGGTGNTAGNQGTAATGDVGPEPEPEPEDPGSGSRRDSSCAFAVAGGGVAGAELSAGLSLLMLAAALRRRRLRV